MSPSWTTRPTSASLGVPTSTADPLPPPLIWPTVTMMTKMRSSPSSSKKTIISWWTIIWVLQQKMSNLHPKNKMWHQLKNRSCQSWRKTLNLPTKISKIRCKTTALQYASCSGNVFPRKQCDHHLQLQQVAKHFLTTGRPIGPQWRNTPQPLQSFREITVYPFKNTGCL